MQIDKHKSLQRFKGMIFKGTQQSSSKKATHVSSCKEKCEITTHSFQAQDKPKFNLKVSNLFTSQPLKLICVDFR